MSAPAARNPHNQEIEKAASAASVSRARTLLARLFASVRTTVAVSLQDGTQLYQPEETTATVVLRDASVLRKLLSLRGELGAAAALLNGDASVYGDVEALFLALDAIKAARRPLEWPALMAMAAKLPRFEAGTQTQSARRGARFTGRKHSRVRDRAAVSYHYDVSDDFFQLWLDSELTYSCAYFRPGTATLDEAQRNKCDHICRKLRLKAGERFLDIGCGWGGLLRFAAREYGARAVGVTLSRNQHLYAQRRIAQDGLADRCVVEYRDYRDLAPLGTFDKAASVGMVEHVGSKLLPRYFQSVFDALRPGGLFLNHSITTQTGRRPGVRGVLERLMPPRSRFVERYVFPDGELPSLQGLSDAAQGVGFEVRDVENLREHYAQTLRHWVKGLELKESLARRLVGVSTYNVWRLYMAGSAHGFAAGYMGLMQMLLAKRSADASVEIPLTRDDIYSPAR